MMPNNLTFSLPPNFSKDFLASIVVFLVALPLCLGIAIASGLPPTAGIVTGIVGGIIVGAMSGSQLTVSGPAAGLVVLVAEILTAYGVAMLSIILLLAGIMQMAAGALKLGVWFRAISPAVIHGMLAGIG
ncbi:MAG TPA: SulP family inorganic anion transporter, partial [Methylophilaceae bacterium]|nr:SulP family inorganic anion transporter [Methylophilaceae bacterium]